METSKQGGGNELLFFHSTDPNSVFFRENRVCCKLFEEKKKMNKIVSPLTADKFRYVLVNIY